MRKLVLMRHAKSDYPHGVGDHGRPLAPRGEREAALAGDWLREHLPPIEAVLCSSATRTRQTLERTGVDAPVTFLDALYDATPGMTIGEINRVSEEIGTLLVVGHEPTTSSVALGLAGPGSDRDAVDAVQLKYPTSALTVLEVPCAWVELEMGGAALTTFHVPR